MKKRLTLLLLVPFLITGLGACAPTPEAVEMYPPDLKSKYRYALTRDAEERGVRIYWVRTPSNEEVRQRLKKSGSGYD